MSRYHRVWVNEMGLTKSLIYEPSYQNSNRRSESTPYIWICSKVQSLNLIKERGRTQRNIQEQSSGPWHTIGPFNRSVIMVSFLKRIASHEKLKQMMNIFQTLCPFHTSLHISFSSEWMIDCLFNSWRRPCEWNVLKWWRFQNYWSRVKIYSAYKYCYSAYPTLLEAKCNKRSQSGYRGILHIEQCLEHRWRSTHVSLSNFSFFCFRLLLYNTQIQLPYVLSMLRQGGYIGDIEHPVIKILCRIKGSLV